MSGLTAAINLKSKGYKVLILEASSQVGGRVASDVVDDFILDRGFQVLLTEYPETKSYLDYEKLELQKFNAGAIILKDGKMHTLADPLRHPTLLLKTAFSRIGTLTDKFSILALRQNTTSKTIREIFAKPEISSLNKLHARGFSQEMIDTFFRPFFGGIFLDDSLNTSSRMLDFVFKMFSEGYAAVPKLGMQSLPNQLALHFSEHEIITNTKVKNVNSVTNQPDVREVIDVSGNTYYAKTVLLAGNENDLLNNQEDKDELNHQEGVGTTTVYFWTEKLPYSGPWLMLCADNDSIINNIAIMSEVSPAYAPRNKHLIAVSCLGVLDENQHACIRAVKDDLKLYFGEEVKNWHHLRTYKIRYALPTQKHVQYDISPARFKVDDLVYRTGDYLLNGSISGAMRSGELVADLIASELPLNN